LTRQDESVEGRPLDDAELVERARRGDVDAYEELVQRYQGLANRVAFLVTRDGAEAEDAAQEAFVKAYYALGRFRSGASFKPWLLKIVTNEARNRRRSSGRRAGLVLRAAEERPSGDAAPSPEGVALDAEKRSALLQALETLPETDRLVVMYRYFLELSEAEMATALGCAKGTVKSRLSRALVRLRGAMPAEVAHD
jgi:RNA polymerase sigma factor (sigma-70 family)